MKIGHHFGKRKPRWNFFTDQYHSLVDSSSSIIFKIFLISVGVQILFFLPALYWIFQNYSIIQNLLPSSFDMAENLEFEKKWIVFLIFTSAIFASVVNAFLWLYVYQASQSKLSFNRDLAVSRDEADDRHLAS